MTYGILYDDDLREMLIAQLRQIHAMLVTGCCPLRAVEPLVTCEFRILDELKDLDAVWERPVPVPNPDTREG